MFAEMSQPFMSRWDWAAWSAVLAASAACGAQAALRAWPEYELASADPSYRLQTPETLERVRRASALEMEGQPKAAEHELLIAAAADRRYFSSWALANFYQRQGRGEFWPWARRAIEMSHGDRTSLFALLLKMAPAHRVREELPAGLHAAFGTHLVSAGRLDDALGALHTLDEAVIPILAERLIAEGRFSDALTVWNASQVPRLDPARPGIVNSDFHRTPRGLGFDWRLGSGAAQMAGRLVVKGAPAPGEFASQYLVLLPDRRYRLTVEHEGSGASGKLRWQIDDVADRSNLLRDAPFVNASLDRQSFEFRTSPRTQFARLALTSTSPVPGTASIRRVSLDFAD